MAGGDVSGGLAVSLAEDVGAGEVGWGPSDEHAAVALTATSTASAGTQAGGEGRRGVSEIDTIDTSDLRGTVRRARAHYAARAGANRDIGPAARVAHDGTFGLFAADPGKFD